MIFDLLMFVYIIFHVSKPSPVQLNFVLFKATWLLSVQVLNALTFSYKLRGKKRWRVHALKFQKVNAISNPSAFLAL